LSPLAYLLELAGLAKKLAQGTAATRLPSIRCGKKTVTDGVDAEPIEQDAASPGAAPRSNVPQREYAASGAASSPRCGTNGRAAFPAANAAQHHGDAVPRLDIAVIDDRAGAFAADGRKRHSRAVHSLEARVAGDGIDSIVTAVAGGRDAVDPAPGVTRHLIAYPRNSA
jgi:hypothetical protein